MRRRSRQERLRYLIPTKPPNNDQWGFVHSHAKIRAVFGGNRSGKTEIGVYDALLALLGKHPVRSAEHPPPVYGRYLAPSYEDGIKAVILKKFRQLVPREYLRGGSWDTAWNEKARTLHFSEELGSECRFFSYEQDVNKMGGDDVDFFVLDEHAPENMFIENIARTTDRDGWGVLTMTPEAGISWEYDRIVEATEGVDDGNIEYWFFSTMKNPYLSKAGVAQLEKTITDERIRDAKLHGRFVALSGLVYPQFDKSVHLLPAVDRPQVGWFTQFVIDPHHRKPSAMVWVAWNPDGDVCHVLAEEEFAPADGGVRELANFIRAKSVNYSVDMWIGDEAMGGDGLNIYGEKSVLEQLNSEGIPVLGTNQASDKAFAAGVNKVRSMLTPNAQTRKPRLYVHDNCRKTIKQFCTYQYRRETRVDEELMREHVQNKNDDLVTCVRYAVMAEPVTHRIMARSALEGAW